MGNKLVLAGVLAFCGCNSSALTNGSDGAMSGGDAALGSDGGGAVDLRSPGNFDLAGFCGDPNSPRIEFNTMLANSPAVSASFDALNCCDAAELSVISMQIPEPVYVTWRHFVGMGPDLPVTLDLANLPAGWNVAVYSGCSPIQQPGCTPHDQYMDHLAGSLTIARTAAGRYQMSACLTATEPAGAPHPFLHSLRFWTPTVSTP